MALTVAEVIQAISPLSRITESGEIEYWDSVAELWLSLDQAVARAEARRRVRSILGSQQDTAALNSYERSRGL